MGTWDNSHWLKDFSTTRSHQQSRSWGAWQSSTHLFTQLHIKKWMSLVLPALQAESFAPHSCACLPSHLPAFRWLWHSLAVTSLSLVSLSLQERGLLLGSACVCHSGRPALKGKEKFTGSFSWAMTPFTGRAAFLILPSPCFKGLHSELWPGA